MTKCVTWEGRSMKKTIILLIIVLTAFLSTEIFGSGLTLSAAIAAGEANGKEDARIILGFVAGFTLNVVGVGISYALPINLKDEREQWINEQTDNPTVISAYIEAYMRTYRRTLTTSSWIGCGMSVVAFFLLINYFFRGIIGWEL